MPPWGPQPQVPEALGHLHVRQGLWPGGRRARPAEPWGGGSGSRGLSPATLCSPQLTHLFDNEGTVVFAIFMALWGESLQMLGGGGGTA